MLRELIDRAAVGHDKSAKAEFALDFAAPRCHCAAGWTYAHIHLDGRVSRCIQHPGEISGNFFREPLKFLDGPEWCPLDKCVCEQYTPLRIPAGAEILDPGL